MDNIIIVDEKDNVLGVADKMHVHRSGILHRAFSVIVVNNKQEILIQKRADKKYHSGGLWSNSFCSHFYKNESHINALKRAAQKELGLDIQDCRYIGKFTYSVKVGELFENEIDYVYIVKDNGSPISINLEEVSAYRWIKVEECKEMISKHPEKFTEWFKSIVSNSELTAQII